MLAAVIGLVGVLLGLAIDRAYGFWASRRDKLAETAVALRRLAHSVTGGESAPFDRAELAVRLGALYELFWAEHEAFILVPLWHYLRRDTVSQRVSSILGP